MAGKMKKGIRYVFNVVSVLIVILSVLIMISVLLSDRGNIPDVMGYSMLRVLTGSMEPDIPTDSLIIIQREDVSKLKPGDVISFYSVDPELDGMVNTHRIAKIEKQDENYIIHTKGDANKLEDAYTTDTEHVIGKVIWSNAVLGKVVRLISNPLIFVPIIVAPLLMIIFYHIWQIGKTTRQISKEQEEAYKEALEKVVQSKKEKAKKKKEE